MLDFPLLKGKRMKRGWDLAIGAAILAGALALRMADPVPLQQLRNLTFDTYQRLMPRTYNPDLAVTIAAIDEKSLDVFGQWPWSRTTLAKITDRLTQLGAVTIGFDVLFSEPDRTSPTAIVANLPADAQYDAARVQLAGLPDPDLEFAEALARSPSVIAFAHSNDAALSSDPSIQFGYGFSIIGSGTEAYVASKVQGARYAILPLQALMNFDPEHAPGMGDVHAGDPDTDGVIRRVPLVVAIGEKLYPTLAGDALRVGVGGQTVQVRVTTLGTIDKMRIGEAIIPVNDRGELLLHDTGVVPERFFSLGDVLDPNFDPLKVAGRIVLIGSTVEGLKDNRATPLAPIMPGVEIHAQILEQILSGTYLARPYYADWLEIAFLGIFGLVLMGFLYRRSAITGAVVLVGAIALTIGASWWAFAQRGYLLDPIYPGLATVAMYGAGTLVNYLRVEGEKRYVRSAMARYLSPELADQVSQDPNALKLGGELRELTLMFSDIRGFTHISESLDPQALTQLMNSFLTPMTRVIQDREGFIDKYIGDCIMAFWNAPIDVRSHAQKAILAAYDMRAELTRVNASLKENAAKNDWPEVELKVGIGLNSGICCVGNMGSEQRLEYSVLGDTVNIASRLEALSPAYGVDLVIGEETASGATEFALLELDRVRVKGKILPIRIFTGLGDRAVAETPKFQKLDEAHQGMLAQYRAKAWDQAEAALATCRTFAPESLHAFYDLYARRIAEYRVAPPPANWDGVFEAKSKAG